MCQGDEMPLSKLVESVEKPEGRKRLADYLETLPLPHFYPADDHPGCLKRVEQDGTVTIGRSLRQTTVRADLRQF